MVGNTGQEENGRKRGHIFSRLLFPLDQSASWSIPLRTLITLIILLLTKILSTVLCLIIPFYTLSFDKSLDNSPLNPLSSRPVSLDHFHLHRFPLNLLPLGAIRVIRLRQTLYHSPLNLFTLDHLLSSC